MAVGDGVVILRSEVDGLTWVQLISNTTEDIFDVYSESIIAWFAVGANGTILRSTDGGGSGVGFEETPRAMLNVYPNPIAEHVMIQWSDIAIGMATVQLHELLSQVLWSGRTVLNGPF